MNPLVVTVPLLLGSPPSTISPCEFFVNGLEWVGRKRSAGHTAPGAIFAA